MLLFCNDYLPRALDIVLVKEFRNDLKHLAHYSHTSYLKFYHTLYSKWIPKSINFSYIEINARKQLVVMVFNQCVDLE